MTVIETEPLTPEPPGSGQLYSSGGGPQVVDAAEVGVPFSVATSKVSGTIRPKQLY